MFITGALGNKHTLRVCCVFCLNTCTLQYFWFIKMTAAKRHFLGTPELHTQVTTLDTDVCSPLSHTSSAPTQFQAVLPTHSQGFPSHPPSADLSWQDSCSLKCSCQALSPSGSNRTQRWQLHLVSAEPNSHFMTDLELCFQKCPKPNNLTEINGAANALLPDTRTAPSEHQLLNPPFSFFKKVSRKIILYWVFLVKIYSVWAKAFFIYADKNLTLVYHHLLCKEKEAFSP